MKMVDVGYTYPKSKEATGAVDPSSHKQYPSFTVKDKKEMFEKCQVGKEYTITAKVKCTRKESNENENTPAGQSFDFQIQELGISGMRGMNHDDYAKKGTQGRQEKADELMGSDDDGDEA